MNRLCVLGLLIGLSGSPALAAGQGESGNPPATDKERFIASLMARMSNAEKIGQLRLVSVGADHPKEALMADIRAGKVGAIFNTVTRPDIRAMQDQVRHSRLKIPLFHAYDVAHGHRTIFPISLGLAASWDPEVVARSARISALEASADGLDMSFSPMVDITRDARWGRVSEGFGEDTYLTSLLSGVMVRAYQGSNLAAPDSIMAAVKHFALYGAAEGGRDYNTVDMSLPRMFQDYLPPYKAAVDAGAGAVMVSLNTINGVPATANRWLLTDLLRQQWGFKGLTISDHGAVKELIKHGLAGNERDATRLAIQAGVDMNMNDDLYSTWLPKLLAAGEIDQADIDRACRDVLAAKYDLGLFADPYRRLGKPDDPPFDTNAESRLHRQAAREVAREGLVLLKNRDGLLPLKKQGRIAVIGPLAKSQRDVIGSWSAAGVPRQAVTVYQGLANAVGERATLLYAKGANVSGDQAILDYLNSYNPEVEVDPRSAEAMLEEALRTARDADLVVAVVGESQGMAHEASSRTDLRIPASQRRLLKALKATGKPLVLVLMNGRPLSLGWEQENADAILETWFSGTEGGNAIADVLFGEHNPSGKLTMSFPRSVGQVPVYYNHLNTGLADGPRQPRQIHLALFRRSQRPALPVRLRPQLHRVQSLAPAPVQRTAGPRRHPGSAGHAQQQRQARRRHGGPALPAGPGRQPQPSSEGTARVPQGDAGARRIAGDRLPPRRGGPEVLRQPAQAHGRARRVQGLRRPGLGANRKPQLHPALKAPTAPPASPPRANGSASALGPEPIPGPGAAPGSLNRRPLPPRRSAPRPPSMRPATPPTGCRAMRR